MSNYSTTQKNNISAIVSFLVILLPLFKIKVASEEVQGVVENIFAIVGSVGFLISGVGNIIHRWKKGDITMGGRYLSRK